MTEREKMFERAKKWTAVRSIRFHPDDFVLGLMTDFAIEIESDWTKMTDKPPKPGAYLVTVQGRAATHCDCYSSEHGWAFWGEDVIAYKPMPEPFKEETENAS